MILFLHYLCGLLPLVVCLPAGCCCLHVYLFPVCLFSCLLVCLIASLLFLRLSVGSLRYLNVCLLACLLGLIYGCLLIGSLVLLDALFFYILFCVFFSCAGVCFVAGVSASLLVRVVTCLFVSWLCVLLVCLSFLSSACLPSS